jgi:hypothetical protein
MPVFVVVLAFSCFEFVLHSRYNGTHLFTFFYPYISYAYITTECPS